MRHVSAFRTLLFAALASSLLATTSCQKNKVDATPDDVTSAEDLGQGDEENANNADLVEAAAPQDVADSASPTIGGTVDMARLLSSCATRTYVAATRTLTIDYGPTNCLCPDGRYRRGKITALFSGPYRQTGAIVTIDRANYYVNDNQHFGTRVITNTGQGSFDLSIQNGSIIFANGSGTTTWASQRHYARTAGFGTATILDDAYSITGALTGTNRHNVSYTATITQPLIKKFALGCARHFVSGIIDVTNAKEKTMTLNYDPTNTQACDNIASVTINGKTYTIYLK